MFRIFLKVIVGQMFAIKIGGKESKVVGIILWGVLVLSIAPLLWLVYYMISGMYTAFAEVGHLDLMVAMTLNIGSVLIFMLSLMAAPAIFYFSKDVEYILPLPVKPTTIISAKFAVALVFEYVLAVGLVGVMYVALWPHVGVGLLTFNMILTALTLPILPMVYSTVLIMLLMRFVRFVRNPDRYAYIIGLLSLAFAMVFMFASQDMFTLDEDALIAMLTGEPIAATALNYLFLSNNLAARAIDAATGLLPVQSIAFQLLSVAVALAALGIFFVIAQATYFKGIIGLGESSSAGKKMTRDEAIAGVVGQGAFSSYVKKELRLLFRSPIAFMNSVLMVLFMPVVLIISVVPVFTLGNDDPMMEMLSAIDLTDARTAAIALIAVTVLALVTGGSATVTATAISREGRNFIVMKYLPLRYQTQLHAKAMSGLLVVLPGLLLVFAALFWLFSPPILLAIAAILIAVPCAIFLNYLGLVFDLLRPKLNWDNEAEAVKQNVNVLLMIFGAMGVAGGVGVAGFFWLHTPLMAFVVLFGGSLLLMAFALWLVLAQGSRMMRKIY